MSVTVTTGASNSMQAFEFDCGVRAYPPAALTATGGCGGWRTDAAVTPPPAAARRRRSWWRDWPGAGPPTGPGRRGGPWSSTTSTSPAGPYGAGAGRCATARSRTYCRRFVLPVIAEVELRQLSRLHFARVLEAAPTTSVAAHLRRCLTAMVAAGLEEGLLLVSQDVLRGVPGGRRQATASTPRRTGGW